MKPPRFGTFSIVAFERETATWGVAVQSKFISVGSVVPFAEAGAGAIATQAMCNVAYGPDGLALLRQGISAAEVVKRLTGADAGKGRTAARGRRREGRFGVVHRGEMHGVGRPRDRGRVRLPRQHPVRAGGRARDGPHLRVDRRGHLGPAPGRALGRSARRGRPAGNAGRRAVRGPKGRGVRQRKRPLGRPARRRAPVADRGAPSDLQDLRHDDAQPRGPGRASS